MKGTKTEVQTTISLKMNTKSNKIYVTKEQKKYVTYFTDETKKIIIKMIGSLNGGSITMKKRKLQSDVM